MPSERRLVAGIGCTAAATKGDILGLVETCLAEAGASRADLSCLATTARRRTHPGLVAAADALGVPLRVIDDETLSRQVPPTPSRASDLSGLPGVAEAAASCAGRLILLRRTGRGVTCALAEVPEGFVAQAFASPA